MQEKAANVATVCGNSWRSSDVSSFVFFKWWSRWDYLSPLEENRRKTANFASSLPLIESSNVP
jgi:hypothetical protein